MARVVTQIAPIASDEIEPTAAMIVGRLFARCQAAINDDEKESAYMNLWWVVNALSSLAVAVGTTTHFSIASSNHVRWTRQMIEKEFGIDPFDDPHWKYR